MRYNNNTTRECKRRYLLGVLVEAEVKKVVLCLHTDLCSLLYVIYMGHCLDLLVLSFICNIYGHCLD
jgi:hypothetical protein